MTDKWNGEEWVEFMEVLAEEVGSLMGHREAERTLRKLCASGIVRAIEVYEDGPKFIPRKEWTKDSFEADGVYLSCNDLSRWWLDLQNKPIQEAGKCMSSEHFGQWAWQFKRMSGSSG